MIGKKADCTTDENRPSNLNQAIPTFKDVVSTNLFPTKMGRDTNSHMPTQINHKAGAKTVEPPKRSDVSRLVSNMALDKWDSMMPPPTPQPAIESILGKGPKSTSRKTEIKSEAIRTSPDFIGNTFVQNPIMMHTAQTNYQTTRGQVPAGNNFPYYNWVRIDNRVLSRGAELISEAPMEAEYEEMWNETLDLIVSQSSNLGQ